MIAWVTLVALVLLGVGLWLIVGVLERLTVIPEEAPCLHQEITYSPTTGVSRCMFCGTPVGQEFWD